MGKFALFAFKGDAMCFVHVLLNALDMKEKGIEVRIVIEGEAAKLIPDFSAAAGPLKPLFEKARGLNLIDGVCMACSGKLGTLEAARSMGLNLLNEMSGHPAMGRYLKEGYQVITF